MFAQNAWIEVNLDALTANLTNLRTLLAPGVQVMAVVKADAYGLGALACAKQFAQNDVDMLAVSTLGEGQRLRAGGISLPILVFIPMLADEAALMRACSLTPSIDSEQAAAAWQAVRGGDFHLAINTGMNRFGIDAAEATSFCKKLASFPDIHMSGIYSHIAYAQERDPAPAKEQIALFRSTLQKLAEAGHYRRGETLAHLANSGAVLRFPEAHFDMVRAGTLLYGEFPAYAPHSIPLKEPYRVKARLVAVRQLPKGAAAGYGGDFKAKRERKIGVLPLGYADGLGSQLQVRPASFLTILKECLKLFNKWLRPKAAAVCFDKGRPLRTVGRIAMQTMAIDISKTDLQLGDPVTVRLRRTAASLALPRLYVAADRVVWQTRAVIEMEEQAGEVPGCDGL